MLRFILLIAVIIAAGYFTYERKQEHTAPKVIAYAEGRLVFKIPGREVEGVLIAERDKSRPCDETRIMRDFEELCAKGQFCAQSKVECKDSVDSKYMKMLAKGPAHTSYVHLQHKSDALRGVAVLWGLTKEESVQACKIVTEQLRSNREINATAECI